ncbi:hypothetical protein [Alkalinema sp. FACHB-956]|uniref:hypothetical protein n=1 Tax=Alkalinema sp. FACHB-956 TaxID=2692768 RepID=UPI0016835FB6|nr:hypothetical protein [Alkalinema sp. FACHB-956]MBD2328300.1 hypothetical protein [Alkalinema sp. FACHB-956]
MDTLHTQVTLLNQKMDALFQAIEELSRQVSNALGEMRAATHTHSRPYGSETHHHHHVLDDLSDHKDILVDSYGMETMTSSNDRIMSPELQIQRLTAQLTAAYNRIAALEEQLLARRIS